jgi:7,8-dihydro-6-hydroxymethylpterin dimethyltransferase
MEKHIKKTISRCTICNTLVSGSVFSRQVGLVEKVYLSRTCPEHGTLEHCISTDARLYHEAVGPLGDDCCGGSCGKSKPVGKGGQGGYLGANALGSDKIEKLASCVTLIEITSACNMSCNSCFAEAIHGAPVGSHMSFEEFSRKIENVISRKGELEILQLSGGEPTVHPEFLKILEWSCAHPNILCVLVNTNGLKIATDESLANEMARIEDMRDKIHIYLQFDGVQEQGQKILRQGDFREVRVRALDVLEKIKIPTTLAMTVNQLNLPFLWDTVKFGLTREAVHGVSFQPEFLSGRNPIGLGGILPEPITVADVITNLCDSSGILTFDDMTPTPCGHPMCQWIGWLGKTSLGLVTPTQMGINLPELQAKIGNRIRFSAADLASCQCDGSDLGALIHKMEGLVQQTKVFRLFIKPFMDVRNWDEDRVARCCTHVVGDDGKLDSFCRHYADRGIVSQKPKLDLRRL